MSTRKRTRTTRAPAKKRATPPRKPKAATPRAAPARLRTLADVEPSDRSTPRRSGAKATLARKARATLEAEFEHALALKEKLAAEAAIGGKEKGREALRQAEKVRSLVASLEGMSRFALKMGLITPAESRDIYAAAMKRGLYDGWR